MPLFSWRSTVDLGAPSINAVCKIKLKSGLELEGMLCIISGGYGGYLKSGFASSFDGTEYFNYELFNLGVYGFHQDQNARTNRKTKKRENPEKFFLSATGGSGIMNTSTRNDTTMEHTLVTSREYNYKILKHINIYNDLLQTLYLPVDGYAHHLNLKASINGTEIAVDDISTFELVSEPSKRWTELIQSSRDKTDEVRNHWVDYQEPLWYHEVRANLMIYNRIQKYVGGRKFPYPYD